MKYLNIILCALMLLFVGVQYNDPDGLLWVAIYLVPAVATGLVAFRPQWAVTTPIFRVYGVILIAALAGTAYYWPRTPDFWQQEVWWNTETAREGMGMMIATVTVAIAVYSVWKKRRRSC